MSDMSTEVNPNQPAPKGKGKGFMIIALVAVLVLVAGGLSYAFIFSKSPLELYLAAEVNTYEKAIESLKDTYKDEWELAEKSGKEPSVNEMEVRFGLQADGMESQVPDLAMVQKLLEDSKIKIVSKLDPKKEKAAVSMGYHLNDTPIADVNLFHSKKETGFQVPVLYDDYLYLPNAELGEFARRMDPTYDGPEEIEYFIEADATKTLKELNEIGKDYAEYLAQFIKDEHVTLEKNVEFHGEKMRQLTVSLSEAEVKKVMKGLLGKIEKDKSLSEFLYGQVFGQFPMAYGEELKEEFKEKLVEAIERAKDGVDDVKFPGGYKAVVLVDKNETIVSRDVKLKIAQKDNADETVDLSYKSEDWDKDDKKNESNWKLEMKVPEDVGGKINASAKTVTSENKRALDFALKVTEHEEDLFGLTYKSTTKGKKGDEKTDFTVTVISPELESEIGADELPINGHYNRKTDQNLGKGHSNTAIDFGLSVDAGLGRTIGFTADVKSKTSFKDKPTFPNLKNEGVNVAEQSDEELQKIVEEMQKRLQEFIMNNQQLFEGSLGL
ncbi:DUF6583 family protein [Numidum massiliense]|uniref:DUF6583 family protein n=1 Tax=Numidum massiliense TaxID=1522315 RepID=UPI0006D57CD6|nr:DUF6583 family protein [Numidum massiliense]